MAGSWMKKLKSLIHSRPDPIHPMVGVPEHVQEQVNVIINAVEHVQNCHNVPCDTCVRGMALVKETSGNSSLDQATIADQMAERTNFCQMFSATWSKEHLLDLFANSSTKQSNRVERSFTFFRALAGTCWNYTDESDAFCRKLGEEDSLKILVDWMLSVVEKGEMNKWTTEIVFNVMNILHNVCRRLSDIGQTLRRVVPALQKLSESDDPITKTCAFITLSYLVKKDEADKLSTNDTCVDTLLSLLSQSLQTLDHKIRIERVTATDAIRRFFTLSALELVQGIEQLAINDNNKLLITQKGGIKGLGRMLELDCTAEEKTHAAHGLWRLAFLKENRDELRQEQDIIKDLIQHAGSDNTALRTACIGALFEIYDSKVPEEVVGATGTEVAARAAPFADKKPSCNIMISYKWENPSKNVMREFKDQLKSKGYNVWMDEEFMSGDMIDAMTSAVENADVILACITQGYQESKNCRTEATYAYDCNKKIVPVKVNDKFTATGWLGGVTAGKIYYLVKGVDEVSRELPRIIELEIEKKGKAQEGSPDKPEQANEQKPTTASESDVSVWDVGKVREWLKANGISTRNKRLRNLNGAQVLQLKKQLLDTRQGFFQSMKEDLKMEYTDVLSLAAALEKLD